MAILTKKLKIKSGSTTKSCNIYTTTAETSHKYIRVKVDGQNAYVALGGVGDSNVSKGRVKKSGTTYAIKTTASVPYKKIEYKTPGTYTLTVPSGVTKLKVEIAGAGGGGGGGAWESYQGKSGSGTHHFTGGNGGRGALVNSTITISSTTVKIVVGKGGTGGSAGGEDGTGGTGSTGGTSSVASTSAKGGTGGTGGRVGHVASKGSSGTSDANGSAGTSYGNGGTGGAGGTGSGSAGANGWVIVEYGGDIV